MSELTRRIHSLESFGTVDGPGIRYVVFFQGCPMRCLYCHNPDTWEMAGGTQMTADEIIEKITRNREFYTSGGITATGGEPICSPRPSRTGSTRHWIPAASCSTPTIPKKSKS